RAAGRRAIGPRAIFREHQVAAFMVAGIEIDRHRETAMGGALRRIVAMATKMAARLRLVAADQQPLDPGRLELEGALHHRQQAMDEAQVELPGERGLLDQIVPPNLVSGIDEQLRYPADVAHESRFLAAIG